ncbi:glycosyltransferase family protein [Cucumibacter marinus]|uniref:hypothetical protein n=1 Tax=Cucumibacter marinus TaxID=1121252 RepID=UPI0004299C1F|nr:hypothetical protein [Cucumibacter marinus]
MRLLFISNGHGEDSMAREMIARLPGSVTAHAYPTLGDGHAFAGVCDVVGPRAHIASEGWRTEGSIRADLKGGIVATFWPALSFLRRARHDYDHVVVVGDLVGVGACFLSGIRGITWVDAYRTGHGRLYAAPERWLIKATCRRVFCRSEKLAKALAASGIDARAAGNVLIDTVTYGDFDPQPDRHRAQAITLLPGSRKSASENFALQVSALRQLPPDRRPDLFLALAPGLDPAALAEAADLTFDLAEASDLRLGHLSGDGFIIVVVRGATGNLIEAADIVLSQAGTATIQALGLGKPVVSFRMSQERESRVKAESALFGDGRMMTEADPAALATAVTALLNDPDEIRRRGAAGQARVGGPGAIEAILASVLDGS